MLLPEHEASATRLGDLADEMLSNPLKLTTMAQAMGMLARPQATSDIVAELLAIARPPRDVQLISRN